MFQRVLEELLSKKLNAMETAVQSWRRRYPDSKVREDLMSSVIFRVVE